MGYVVGLPNNAYKPITNTAWASKLQKGALDSQPQVYQLLAHGRWFSPGTPASSITKTGRHDIAEILLKVALKHQQQQKQKNKKSNLKPVLCTAFSLIYYYHITLKTTICEVMVRILYVIIIPKLAT
jgi:hypothetical protein